MNNNLIDLAIKAGLLNYIDCETPRRYFIPGDSDQYDIEHFAALLLKDIESRLEWQSIGVDPDTADKVVQKMHALFGFSHPGVPKFRPGDRVSVPCANSNGTVVLQHMSFDGAEVFWGNVVVDLDNGDRVTCNSWQVMKS